VLAADFFKAMLTLNEVQSNCMFVPTLALQSLRNIHKFVPSHTLLLADFDQLPQAINGVNGPVVRVHSTDHVIGVSCCYVILLYDYVTRFLANP